MKRTFEGKPLLTICLLVEDEIDRINYHLSRATQDNRSDEYIAMCKQSLDDLREVIEIIKNH